MSKKIYVTAALAEAACKAKAVSKADAKWFAAAPRSKRNSKRYREIADAVRRWASPDDAPQAGASGAQAGDSSADRVAAFVSRRNEIGEIPPVANPARRKKCCRDLELFGWTYCRALLDRRASPIIRERLVEKMQDAMLNGGQLAVQFARGAGKTTWAIISLAWAILYGHRRFPVCISAASDLAMGIRKSVEALLTESDEILADFPAVPTALRKMNGSPQKGTVLTYHGRNVGYETSRVALVLPDLRDEDGRPLDHACGAVLAFRGVRGSVRGLNIRGLRPDFVLFDDPQTKQDAASASAVHRIDQFIHSDALNLAANTKSMAAFLTITPQQPDDLAQRIADRSVHPNWLVTFCQFLVKVPKGFDAAADTFCEFYSTDYANGRLDLPASRAWYRENKGLFNGTETVDPLAYDKATEIDAVHHALNKIASIGRPAFDAEYQLQPVRETFVFELTDRLILSRVRKGVKPGELPPNTVFVAAATDINPSYALTTSVIAFDLALTAQVVAYHVTRIKIPKELPEPEFDRRVFEALAAHGREIAALGLPVVKWGVDAGGRQFPAVTRFALQSAALTGLAATPMLGKAGQNWNPRVDSRVREALNDTVLCRNWQGREWLAWNADTYKEKAQLAWTAEPGAPSGLSLFDGGANHAEFAMQVANETLVSKKIIGTRYKYDWRTKEPHDYGDAVAMCYALAGAYGLTGDGTRGAAAQNPFEGWNFNRRRN